MKKPLVSVVMPAYNAEKYIGDAIESILNQTFGNFEFIIVDDASTDSTGEIIEHFKKKDPRIIVLHNKKNSKIARTRNRGVSKARGNFIVTMDADDISLPNRLFDQLNLFDKNEDIHICIGDLEVIDENGEYQYLRKYPLTHEKLKAAFFRYNPVPNPTVMCRRKVYSKIGKYDIKYHPIDDMDFWLRAGQHFKFGNVGVPVLKYRVFESSTSHKKLRWTEWLTFRLRCKAVTKLGYEPSLGDIIYNVLHFSSFILLPSYVKIRLFNLLRKYK